MRLKLKLFYITLTQSAITCSNLTIETLEQRCEICSKLTVKPTKQRYWHHFGGFIVNSEHISHLFSSVSILNFEQVNAGWAIILYQICRDNSFKWKWE